MGAPGVRRPVCRRHTDRLDRNRAGGLHGHHGDHRVGPAAQVHGAAHRPGRARRGRVRGVRQRITVRVPLGRGPCPPLARRPRRPRGPADPAGGGVGPADVATPFRPVVLTDQAPDGPWEDAQMPYVTPGSDVISIVDTPPTPLVRLAPGGEYLALVHYESHPPVAMLAQPYLPLAGIRIDPVLGGRRRLRRLTDLSVLRLADGLQRSLPLPAGAQVSPPVWAPDGRHLAFTVDEPDGIGVWVADAETATASPVPGLRVRDVLGAEPPGDCGTVQGSGDGRSLRALAPPAEPVTLPVAPPEPHLEETAGKRSQMATF